MIVQVYEITNVHEASLMVAIGVDHIGVLVGKGAYPREIPFDQAREIFRSLPTGTKGVALSLSGKIQELIECVEMSRPDILHLGTLPKNLLPEDIQVVRSLFPYIEIMRSIPIEDDTAVQIAQQFVKVSDYLLLDSHIKHDTQIGATGMTHDWNISQRIVASVAIPVVLAGGLGPENVAQAIERVRPSGVDSKTQTDKPGTHHKDPERVKNFVHRAKSR